MRKYYLLSTYHVHFLCSRRTQMLIVDVLSGVLHVCTAVSAPLSKGLLHQQILNGNCYPGLSYICR